MKTIEIARPLNGVQTRFNELCRLAGGRHGGPARGRLQELLVEAGKILNVLGHKETANHLAPFPERNPWHVCYAVALSWGHLAQLDLAFTEATINLMSDWNDADLRVARTVCYERGPDTVEESLRAGHMMFQQVTLPKGLPTSLKQCGDAQQRWLSVVLSPRQPQYMGSWNATAVFMVSLFADRILAGQLQSKEMLLPPSGAVFNGLTILHRAGFLSRPPAGSELDDAAFEPGALYENNALFEEALKGHSDCNMIDIHSGIYMLGTRLPDSKQWFAM